MTTADIPPGAVLLTEAQVAGMVGFAPRTIRSWVSAKTFPQPVHLPGVDQVDDRDRFAGARRPKRWLRAEVEAWIAKLAEGRA
jgi:predicted DNA-binding transcriptional regulator AlpA